MAVGMEVVLLKNRDFLIGKNIAMHSLGGDWLKCKLVEAPDVIKFAEVVTSQYRTKASAPIGSGPDGPSGVTPTASEAGEVEVA